MEVVGRVETVRQIVSDIKEGPRAPEREFTIRDWVVKLIEDGFLDQPKSLTDMKRELEIYGFETPTTSISPILWRDFVKKGLVKRNGTRRAYRYFVETE